MIDETRFKARLADLANCLPSRDGSQAETTGRTRTYYRHLGMLDERDFDEAVDRVIYLDEWFPTIARLRFVVHECRADRAKQQQSAELARPVPTLVCPYCHGARWVRLGGYDPLNMLAGEDSSRVQPCPRCTTGRRFDPDRERALIFDEGGIPNPNPPREIDMSRVTWPQTMQQFRDPATGALDMDRLYAYSRELRGLDPRGDNRPQDVAGFGTVGRKRQEAA